jgi:tetratricopeptide (TPR) repeat protein
VGSTVATSGSVPAPSGPSAISRRQVLERYTHLREDHLRYMQKWGVVRPVASSNGEASYAFSDLSTLRQADAELAEGATFRAVMRNLAASRAGQLTFDFRIDAQRAKVLQLKRPDPPPMAALMDAQPRPSAHMPSAEQYFMAASILDDGDPANFDEAAIAYRRALEIDPYMVPALINLANIHYARDEIAEAQALYERAIALEADVFEAHFNLGNILHDLGRYPQAQACYRDALRLNPTYADAHFYLAVTLEKNGQSPDARPHWKAYQQLAPTGEWVHLAKEFSD